MIYLFAITLWVGASTSGGWISGQYDWHAGQYATIAACEAARSNLINFAKTRPTRTLISKCAASADLVEFRSYTSDERQDGSQRSHVLVHHGKGLHSSGA